MEGKASGAFIKLVRGNADIKKHAVNGIYADLGQQALHFSEVALYDMGAAVAGKARCHSGYRVRILIYAVQTAGRKTAEDLCGMASAAGGAVHIYSVASDIKRVDRFLQQDGNMPELYAPHSFRLAYSLSSSRASFMLACFCCSIKAEKASLSQISTLESIPTTVTSPDRAASSRSFWGIMTRP